MWTTQTKELFSKPDQQQVLGGGRTTYKQAVQQIGLWRLVASGRRPERSHSLLEQIALQLKTQHDGILTADLLRLELEKRAQVTSEAASPASQAPTAGWSTRIGTTYGHSYRDPKAVEAEAAAYLKDLKLRELHRPAAPHPTPGDSRPLEGDQGLNGPKFVSKENCTADKANFEAELAGSSDEGENERLRKSSQLPAPFPQHRKRTSISDEEVLGTRCVISGASPFTRQVCSYRRGPRSSHDKHEEVKSFEAALQQVKDALQQQEPVAQQKQDKPYVCGRCQHSFGKNSDLTRHLKDQKTPCVPREEKAAVRQQQIQAAKAKYRRSSPGKAKRQTE